MPLSRATCRCGAWALLGMLAAPAPGCARSAVQTASHVASPALDRTPGAALPYLRGAEVLTVGVTLFGVSAADLRIEASQHACSNSAAKGAAVVRSWAKTTGLFDVFFSARVETTTSLDPSSGLPINGSSHWATDSKPRDYRVRFDRGSYSYDYRRSDGFSLSETVSVPEGMWAHDMHSGALLLRSWRPAIGERAHAYGVVGRHLWRVEVVFRGPDVLVRREGERAAVRIEGVAQRLTGAETERVSRSFRIWFSDDAERLPLRALIESKWGDAWLELLSHEQADAAAGCAQAATPPSADAGAK